MDYRVAAEQARSRRAREHPITETAMHFSCFRPCRQLAHLDRRSAHDVGTPPCLAVPSAPSGIRFAMLWDRNRVRPRTHGGVGGREEQSSLLPHAMRMTVLPQMAKGLPDKTSDGAEESPLRNTVVRALERLKWLRWQGNV